MNADVDEIDEICPNNGSKLFDHQIGNAVKKNKRSGDVILENSQYCKRNSNIFGSSVFDTDEFEEQQGTSSSTTSHERFIRRKVFAHSKKPIPVPGWVSRQLEDCGTQTPLESNNISDEALNVPQICKTSATDFDSNGVKTNVSSVKIDNRKQDNEVAGRSTHDVALLHHEKTKDLFQGETQTKTAILYSNNIYNRLSQELQCSVCQELFVQATVLTGCGHTFCSSCINEWLRRSHNACPNCRCSQTRQAKCPVLDTVIDIVMENSSEIVKKERAELINQREELSEQQHRELVSDIEGLQDSMETTDGVTVTFSGFTNFSTRETEFMTSGVNNASMISQTVDYDASGLSGSTEDSDSSDSLSSLSSFSSNDTDNLNVSDRRRILYHRRRRQRSDIRDRSNRSSSAASRYTVVLRYSTNSDNSD